MSARLAVSVGTAVALSLLVHGAGLVWSLPDDPETLAGGPSQLAMLGNSFENLTQGTLSAKESDTPPAEAPETPTTEPRQVEDVVEAKSEQLTTSPVKSAPTKQATPDPVQKTSPLEAQTTPVPVLQAPAMEAPAMSRAEVAQAVAAPKAEVVSITTPPLDAVPTVTTETASAVTSPTETVTAAPEVITQVAGPDTPRPKPRPAREPRAEPQRDPTQTTSAPRGNSSENARQGQANGAAAATAATNRSGSQAEGSSTTNSQEAARYRDKVMRRIARTRRARVRQRGTTRIAFTIAANGGLSALSVAVSSGSPDLDKIALDHVRRSAPFPPPPVGLKPNFVVPIKGAN